VGKGFCGEGKRHKECECISWTAVLRNRRRLHCLRAARGAHIWSAGGERAGRDFVKVTLGCWGVIEDSGSWPGRFLGWRAVESCNLVVWEVIQKAEQASRVSYVFTARARVWIGPGPKPVRPNKRLELTEGASIKNGWRESKCKNRKNVEAHISTYRCSVV